MPTISSTRIVQEGPVVTGVSLYSGGDFIRCLEGSASRRPKSIAPVRRGGGLRDRSTPFRLPALAAVRETGELARVE